MFSVCLLDCYKWFLDHSKRRIKQNLRDKIKREARIIHNDKRKKKWHVKKSDGLKGVHEIDLPFTFSFIWFPLPSNYFIICFPLIFFYKCIRSSPNNLSKSLIWFRDPLPPLYFVSSPRPYKEKWITHDRVMRQPPTMAMDDSKLL